MKGKPYKGTDMSKIRSIHPDILTGDDVTGLYVAEDRAAGKVVFWTIDSEEFRDWYNKQQPPYERLTFHLFHKE